MDATRFGPAGTKYCALCAKAGLDTPSEWYRSSQLDYCTFHYWLIRGRVEPHGYPLEEYLAGSQRFAFRASLPSEADCRAMLMGQSAKAGPSRPVIGIEGRGRLLAWKGKAP